MEDFSYFSENLTSLLLALKKSYFAYFDSEMLFSQLVICIGVLICIGATYAATSVINYEDGGVYTGEVVANRKEGYGEMKYSTGDVYTGFWRNDTINGRGRIIYANGNWYDGDWVNARHHGGGTKVWANAGTKYSGEWVLDRIQGFNTLL